MQDDSKGVADRLRETREKSDLSQRELAALTGVSHAYPGHVESGKVERVRWDIAQRFARVLGCSWEWILTGAGDKPTKQQVLNAVAVAREESKKTPAPPEGSAA